MKNAYEEVAVKYGSLPGKDQLELIHVSTNRGLEGFWLPKANYESLTEEQLREEMTPSDEEPFPYPEYDLPRISVSHTVEGAYRAITPSLVDSMGDLSKVKFDIYVYAAELRSSTKVVTNEALLKNELVWDAHITGEWLILDRVFMRKVGKFTIDHPDKLSMEVHPFNNKKLPKLKVELYKF